MGMNHKFMLLSVDRFDLQRADYLAQLKSSPGKSIVVHDNLLRYVSDCLKWIRSYNPSVGKWQTGLNLCGITVIRQTGAQKAADVFEDWAKLFSRSPSTLRLTGLYGVSGTKAGYEVLNYDRDATVDSFRELSRMCRKVAKSQGKFFVLHLGI
jgi:hypothetical protein